MCGSAGVNPLDNNLLGRLTVTSSYPFVVGIDFAGIAERVPPGAHGLQDTVKIFGHRRGHMVPMPKITAGRACGPVGPYPRRRGR